MDTLRLALAVTRYGRGPRRISSQLRQGGPEVAHAIYEQLEADQQNDIEREAHALAAAGVAAVLLSEDDYPVALATLRQAPPALFYRGNGQLLGMRAIGVCGSRDATSQGLNAARACGEEIVRQGLVVVSGYARGVDTEAHSAALDAGGQTAMVLPEGIARFTVKRWLANKSYRPEQVTVVSQFAPGQTWVTGAAMGRNMVIIGLSLGLVVIEARETGGTLAAGLAALDERRPVFALEFRADMPPGNKVLLDRGAFPVRSRSELAERLRQILSGEQRGQLTLL